MTKTSSKILLFSAIVAATIVSVVFTNEVAANEPVEEIIIELQTNDKWLHGSSERAIIDIQFENKETATVMAGDRLTLPVTLKHITNNENAEEVVLRPSGTVGVVIPEPYSSQYTSFERSEQLRETGSIIGAVDLGQFVSYSEELVSIEPNTTVEIQMFIDIPTDIESNLTNVELAFQPSFAKIKAEQVMIDNAIKDVLVIPSGD